MHSNILKHHFLEFNCKYYFPCKLKFYATFLQASFSSSLLFLCKNARSFFQVKSYTGHSWQNFTSTQCLSSKKSLLPIQSPNKFLKQNPSLSITSSCASLSCSRPFYFKLTALPFSSCTMFSAYPLYLCYCKQFKSWLICFVLSIWSRNAHTVLAHLLNGASSDAWPQEPKGKMWTVKLPILS